jgi:hypothetical protein
VSGQKVQRIYSILLSSRNLAFSLSANLPFIYFSNPNPTPTPSFLSSIRSTYSSIFLCIRHHCISGLFIFYLFYLRTFYFIRASVNLCIDLDKDVQNKFVVLEMHKEPIWCLKVRDWGMELLEIQTGLMEGRIAAAQLWIPLPHLIFNGISARTQIHTHI